MSRTQPPKSAPPAPEFFSPQVSAARRFYLNLNPPRHTPLAVVSGGCEHCAPDYEIHRATFPFYSIEYVVRGAGSLKLDSHHHELRPGTVFSYGPGVRQDIHADPNDPPVKYFVDFTGKKSLELLCQSHVRPGTVSQVFPANEIQNLFDELIRCGQRSLPKNGGLCEKLLECLGMKIAEARATAGAGGTLAFTTYQQCRRYIEGHFPRLKTLRQIAQECHVDGAYLCRLFQKFDHQTPYQFLIRLKMSQAAEWLLQPGTPVKQIAERAGFGDQFHFSRVFKSVFGVAPDTFRRLR